MYMQQKKSVTVFLAALTLTGLSPSDASAQSHPQEVLDLIGSYEALAMKVRPLKGRVVVASSATDANAGFRPEGVPLRAQTATGTTGDNSAAERRAPERLRHKDRTASTDDDYTSLTAELAALERETQSELERIRAPGFGTSRQREGGGVRFGDRCRKTHSR